MHSRDDHLHSADSDGYDWNNSYSGGLADYEEPDPTLLELATDLPPGNALDLGCGAGGLVIALSELGWKATGIDIAGNAISIARAIAARRHAEVEFHVADATTWAPQSTYNLITSSFALPNEIGRDRVYRLMRESLAPNGIVAIKDFDVEMQHIIPGCDLTISELMSAFDGFEVIRAEIVDTPVHGHADEGHAAEDWTAVIFVARKLGARIPGAQP
jgi:SAM-dependent methyltransferase